MTARGIFDTLDVPAGGFLLQSASGSVLGRLIIQMAQHYSIKTINVVRRNEQKAELIGIGYASSRSGHCSTPSYLHWLLAEPQMACRPSSIAAIDCSTRWLHADNLSYVVLMCIRCTAFD